MSTKPRARCRWVNHPRHGEAIALSVPYNEDFITRLKYEIPGWQRVWNSDSRTWFVDPAARFAVFAVARMWFDLFWNNSIVPSCPSAPPRAHDDYESNWAARQIREARRAEAARVRLEQEAAKRRRDDEIRRTRAEVNEQRRRMREEARRAQREAKNRRDAEAREDRARRPNDVPLDFFSRRAASDADFMILRVPPWSSLAVAKASYRKLVATHHPDVGGNIDHIQRLNVAWSRISRFYDDEKTKEATA